MNDLDDIRRAIDDDIYAHGRVLEPTDRVRRAIARRRTVNRFAVASTSALVAAAAVVAVSVIQRNGNEANVGTPTTGATATGLTSSSALTSDLPTGSPSPTGNASPTPVQTPSPALSNGALPTGGVSNLLAAVQWHGTYGALVAVDPATGTVIHTYTTGITNPAADVLRFGNEAYFVSKTGAKGCAAEWTGIDLVSGDPTAVPSPLTDHPITSALMTAAGDVITIDGACTASPSVNGYSRATAADGKSTYRQDMRVGVHMLAITSDGQQRQMAYIDASAQAANATATTISVSRAPIGTASVSNEVSQSIQLPDGCTPTAAAFAGQELVAGLTCQVNKALVLTVLRWDAKGVLIMRKDVTTKFKEASISDVAVLGQDIYYVVNAEGTNADLFRLTEGKDVSVATDLFHIAAQP